MMGNVKLILWRYFEAFRSSRLFSRLRGWLVALYHQGYRVNQDRSWIFQDRSWIFQDRFWIFQDRSWIFQDRSWIVQDRSRIFQDRSWIFQDRSWIFQDRSKWQNWKSIFAKTRVGFGRTELSLRLSCTEFCALSSGHGPRGRGFEGEEETLDFCDCLGGRKSRKTWKCKMNMVRVWSPELSTLAKWSP